MCVVPFSKLNFKLPKRRTYVGQTILNYNFWSLSAKLVTDSTILGRQITPTNNTIINKINKLK